MRRYAQIRKTDISDGPGFRCAIYTQGCSHKCKNCFNPETWDYEGGTEWTKNTNEKIYELLGNEFIDGLSVLGGDPFDYYLKEYKPSEEDLFLELLQTCKKKFPDKSIWLWTGFLWENFVYYEDTKNLYIDSLGECVDLLLKEIDVIVDGPFIEEKKDFNLYYRGSSNQRIIDVKKSLEKNEVILWTQL